MHAIYEVPISYSSKVIVKVKVDDRQTDRQKTDRTKTICPDHSIQGHKNERSIFLGLKVKRFCLLTWNLHNISVLFYTRVICPLGTAIVDLLHSIVRVAVGTVNWRLQAEKII